MPCALMNETAKPSAKRFLNITSLNAYLTAERFAEKTFAGLQLIKRKQTGESRQSI